eukprot:Phypoly_transcript_02775.p1 GENE.Phypoly_transcript_02775~~Phypoly_transcript_02775.p1  ORF type:complete len:874 (+),score=213.14 Phypoly_transcript_02775:33-2624(+)
MGVQGLATYVAKHKDYKYQEHIDLVEWAKQKGFAEVGLVIDGYSLMYRIAEKLEWDYLNGGQYAKLHTAAQEYFQTLLVHGVKLLVVFDGLLHANKLNVFTNRRNDDIEHILRSVQKIKDTGELSLSSTKFVMPVLSGTIFKAAISDLGVTVVCTLYEADRHIAYLASPLNPESKTVFWTVVGQDSDYLIYNTNGYAPLESFSTSPSLTCDLYTAEHTAKGMGIPAKKLGVLGALAANDFLTAKELADFHNRILPRGQKISSYTIIDELIYNIKKNKIETDDTQKLAEYVFKDKNRVDREKYIPILKEAIAGYNLATDLVPYEREFKRWAQDTSASVWRDTKIELPDYISNYTNGVEMSEVVSVLFARQWTFCLPFEDLKKVNSVLLLQSFRKTLYNWIFYDNPRVEFITEHLCWELKYFDMRVPVSRKDAKLYMQNFKEIFTCSEEVKLDVMYQVMGFPTASTLVKQLDSDFLRWLACSIRIILGISKDKKKANKESTFLFEYEVDALLLTMLLKNPAITGSISDLPDFPFDDIFATKPSEPEKSEEETKTNESEAKTNESEAKTNESEEKVDESKEEEISKTNESEGGESAKTTEGEGEEGAKTNESGGGESVVGAEKKEEETTKTKETEEGKHNKEDRKDKEKKEERKDREERKERDRDSRDKGKDRRDDRKDRREEKRDRKEERSERRDRKEERKDKKEDRKEKDEKKETKEEKKEIKEDKKVKLNIYSMNVGALFQLSTMHFRLFVEIMGNLITGYLDFIRCFDGTHFAEMYLKLYKNRSKEWESIDEYLNYAIGTETLATEEVKQAFLQVKACLVEGFRMDDIFSKQIVFAAPKEDESKKREELEGAPESASKKLKT